MRGLKSLLVDLHWLGRNFEAEEDYRVFLPLLVVRHVERFVVNARCVLSKAGLWKETEWRNGPFEIFCLDKEDGGELVPFVTRRYDSSNIDVELFVCATSLRR